MTIILIKLTKVFSINIKSFLITVISFLMLQCSLNVPELVTAEMKELPKVIDFNYHVKPILSDRCFKCHGPDKKTRKAELRLDIEEDAFASLESGNKAFVKGSVYRSEGAHRILSSDADIIMPPPDSNLKLSSREKAILLKWIDQGAEWKEHWSFIPPQKTKIISKKYTNLIDPFISLKLEENGLTFSKSASLETLVRRIHFDLTGLPPTIEQIESFLNDKSKGAIENLIDGLQNSDAYAERLTLDWLDLSRYADSHGLHADGLRTMWPWRDWVIQAFKKKMPYDQFVTWQLAGDLLPNATREQKLATAFNRNTPMTAEGGVIDEEWRLNYVFDRTETLSTAFLGLTVACAKCHDHKFDPISQKDYFQLTAFFNNIRELGMTGDDGDYGPLLTLPDQITEDQLALLDRSIQQIEKDIKLTSQELAALDSYMGELPKLNSLKRHEIAYYPFDRIRKTKKYEKSDYAFIADENKNAGATLAPIIIEGIKDKAVRFEQDYDRIYLNKEIPNFEWTDPFSSSLWINTDQLDTEHRQVLIGTNGGKNSMWRGWDLYLDEKNHINMRLINIAPGNMIHVKSDEKIPINKWKHIAFAYDGSGKADGMELFIDGGETPVVALIDNLYKSIKTVSASAIKIEYRPVLVGKSYEDSTGDNGTFSGSMDDLIFYDKKLSALELKILYQSYAFKKKPFDEEIVKSHWIQNNPKIKILEKDLKKLREKWLKTMSPVLEVMVMEELPKPRKTYLYNRGDYSDPAYTVDAKVPGKLPAMKADLPKNRLGLAKWLFSEENPLTARVTVNRYWQMIMGQGLVRTPTDFGVQGMMPSHPELLDVLAIDFIQNNWDINRLIKQIVLSKTYQQTSKASPELVEKDPTNILLARANSYRLPAEMIRDNALATSGLLVNHLGGESVKPYQPEGLWKEKSTFSLKLYDYKTTHGDSLYRRGLYTFIRRTSPPPSMVAFDATSREICTIQRETTSTPLQALVLLNDVQFFEASRVLAERIQKEGGKSLDEQIQYGFRLATSRLPNSREIDVLKELYANQWDYYKKNPSAAYKTVNVGEKPIDKKLNTIKTAALTMLANTLLNHNETYVKR
jgi:hypothetical protein